MKTTLAAAFAIIIGVTATGRADTVTTLNTQASQMDSLAASQGQSKVIAKTSSDFGYFLQKVDSQAVVTGLRNGQYTYTTPSTVPGGAATQTTVSLPTGKVGHGNVYISLALAKQQLSQYGITQPTDQQLYTALMGGQMVPGNPSTTTTGILQMRADGMGWGQIAQKMGFKLGPVMSSMKNANQSIAAPATSNSGTVNAGAQKGKSTGSGVVSASGKSVGSGQSGVSAKGGSGEGIVSGSGRSAGGGNAYGYGKGIVTGSGQTGAASGITSAGGHGNSGQARGQNK
jgi:hypothetical protein